MATHSRIRAWRIPWTEEPGGLQSLGSQRVGHDQVTELACTHVSVRLERCRPISASPVWAVPRSRNTHPRSRGETRRLKPGTDPRLTRRPQMDYDVAPDVGGPWGRSGGFRVAGPLRVQTGAPPSPVLGSPPCSG